MKCCAWSVALYLALAVASASASAAQAFSFYGTWRVDALVGYSEVSLSSDALRRLIGRDVVISPNRLSIGDSDCSVKSMRQSTRKTEQLLLEHFRAGPHDAGVPPETRVLEAEPCGYVFRAGRGIVVYQGGAFYRASRREQRP